MISNSDRSFYIGASDTSMVVGNWKTNTWCNWWLEKLGLYKNTLSNLAMKTGNNYEHKILEALEIKGLEMDKQIITDRLRVNLDGNTKSCIYEVKTLIPIEYDEEFIESEYLPKLKVLVECLKKGEFPCKLQDK